MWEDGGEWATELNRHFSEASRLKSQRLGLHSQGCESRKPGSLAQAQRVLRGAGPGPQTQREWPLQKPCWVSQSDIISI